MTVYPHLQWQIIRRCSAPPHPAYTAGAPPMAFDYFAGGAITQHSTPLVRVVRRPAWLGISLYRLCLCGTSFLHCAWFIFLHTFLHLSYLLPPRVTQVLGGRGAILPRQADNTDGGTGPRSISHTHTPTYTTPR